MAMLLQDATHIKVLDYLVDPVVVLVLKVVILAVHRHRIQ
jgi:hypothetical protein